MLGKGGSKQSPVGGGGGTGQVGTCALPAPASTVMSASSSCFRLATHVAARRP